MTTTEQSGAPPTVRRPARWLALTAASVPAALLVYVVLAYVAGPQILDALLPDGLSVRAATALGSAFAAVPVVAAVALLVTARDADRRPWARAAAPVLVWWTAAVVLVFPGRSGSGSTVDAIYASLAPTVDALADGVLLTLVTGVGAAIVAGAAVTLAFRSPADLATWSPEAARARGQRYLRALGRTFLVVFVIAVVAVVVVVA